MTPAEAAELLAVAAAFDQRTIGEADAIAWGTALIHIDFVDAREAVVEHYRRSRDRLMPTDVIAGVRRIRTLRIQAAGDPPPAADPQDPAAYLEALRQQRHAIADGTLQQRPVAALVVGRAIPRPDYGDAPRRARAHLARAARERAQADEAHAAEHRQRLAEARAELDRARAKGGAT